MDPPPPLATIGITRVLFQTVPWRMLLRYRGGSEMRVLRNDFDNYSNERVHIDEFHPLSNVVPLPPAAKQDRVVGAMRSPPQGDAILKCLNRDDPLRHTYLRRRWWAV